MFTCYLGHPWCNVHVKPLSEEEFRKADDALAAVDWAFDEGGLAEALKAAKRLFEEDA